MAVLLIAEVVNGALSVDATAKALTAAKQMGEVTILCAGSDCYDAAATAATLDGAARVLSVSDAAYGHDLAEPMADLIVSLAGEFSHIAAPSTAASKNVMPRVAALLDVMVISEVTGVVDADTFERPIYAGNAIQTVKSTDATKVMTIRTSTFDAAGEGGSAAVAEMDATANPGGRGVGSEDDFALIEGLADKLGAAVGASRAAVDSGYAPNDWQVGQTGKVVAPDLYIAIGISGAIQHLAGMKDSKVIVAINKDEEAPIFQVADFGLFLR